MTELQKLKTKLADLDVRPRKKWGQNFLINKEIASRIVQKVKEQPSPWLEIGPGLGALTSAFTNERKYVFLIEKDKKLASYWSDKGFHVFCEDALQFDWTQIPFPFTLFGNLPYQIASSLILEMILLPKTPHKMILMMQKEVAQRMFAKTHSKDYSLLTVMVQTFLVPNQLFSVGKSHFYPVPEVSGSVMEFTSRDASVPAASFLKFMKQAFSHRRKKLIKQIPSEFLSSAKVFYTKKNWDLNLRAEELSPLQFQSLYKELERLKQ